MKTSCLFLLIVLFTTFGFPGENIPLPLPLPLSDLRNPEKIFVDGDRLYITEFPTVYIYSLTDFRLVKKFGRGGEGPQEFRGQIHLSVQPGYIMVQSTGKVSFFTTDGDFKNEFKSPYAFRVGVGNGKIYQLIENPDTEAWELVVKVLH